MVFRCDQPLAGDAVAEADEAMLLAVGDGQPMGVLDLQSVPLIDSAGLELLARQQDQFQRRGGGLKIAAANALCRDILRCTDLAKRFELYGDVKAAVRSFIR